MASSGKNKTNNEKKGSDPKNRNTKKNVKADALKNEEKQTSPGVKVSSRSANYREIAAIILLAVCAFTVVCMFGHAGIVGDFIRDVLYGIFGFIGTILLLITLVVLSVTVLRGTYSTTFTGKTVVTLIIFAISVTTLLHTLSGIYDDYMRSHAEVTFFSLFGSLWDSYEVSHFGGGIIAGALSTLLQALISKIGALVVLIPLTLIFTLLLFRFSLLPFFTKVGEVVVRIAKAIGSWFSKIFKKRGSGDPKPIKLVQKQQGQSPEQDRTGVYEKSKDEKASDASDTKYTYTIESLMNEPAKPAASSSDFEPKPKPEVVFDLGEPEDTRIKNLIFDDPDETGNDAKFIVPLENVGERPEPAKKTENRGNLPKLSDSGVNGKALASEGSWMSHEGNKTGVATTRKAQESTKEHVDIDEDDPVDVYNSIEPGNLPVLSKNRFKKYSFPTLDLLAFNEKEREEALKRTKEENDRKQEELVNMLESYGVVAECTSYNMGPTFTQFVLLPQKGQRVNTITNLSTEIKVFLAADKNIRIEVPIPGQNAIGVEMPNTTRFSVYLREILASKNFFEAKAESLPIAIGKDIYGNPIVDSMEHMIHVMIGGTTGSGKSVCTRSMILSMLYKASPDDMRLILIDPKSIEFTIFKNLPHLLTPVITDYNKAASALGWACYEMDKRFKYMERFGFTEIKDYNAIAREAGIPTMPRIVVVIDEYADLMDTARQPSEGYVVRLAQKARACGIHLIIATQRPSADVFTGRIKANVPSKMCFRVNDSVNSRIVLDSAGGESLLGRGDMLCLLNEDSKIRRLQNGFADTLSTKKIVRYIIENNPVAESGPEDLSDPSDRAVPIVEQLSFDIGGVESEADAEYKKILEYVVSQDELSVSELQRKYGMGYNKAAKYFDRLVADGYVEDAKNVGSRKRQIIKKTID